MTSQHRKLGRPAKLATLSDFFLGKILIVVIISQPCKLWKISMLGVGRGMALIFLKYYFVELKVKSVANCITYLLKKLWYPLWRTNA